LTTLYSFLHSVSRRFTSSLFVYQVEESKDPKAKARTSSRNLEAMDSCSTIVLCVSVEYCNRLSCLLEPIYAYTCEQQGT
jgi:hypothetical protein